MKKRNATPQIFGALCLAGLAGSLIASSQLAPRRDTPIASPAMSELFQAERAFAAKSVADGMRAAFLEYFAADGINFTPHPVNTREALSARAAPPGRPPITLDWWPEFGDISAAGDMAYTTGPYELTDAREQDKLVGHGHYFSVWRKQADGTWRVAIDYGIEAPAPGVSKADARPVAARWANRLTKPLPASTRNAVLARDRAFAEQSLRKGTLFAYRSFTSWDDETRLYRDRLNPLIGRKQISSGIGRLTAKFHWQPLAADVASSGDLAYTYGKWETDDRANRGGYYLRVWRHIRGEWRVVAEVMNPIPSQ